MAEIKAIETEYAGYRFRSRLEARWAVFFDGMGFTWEYEPEGFVLEDGTWYLPDFRVYTPQGEPMWYEVKPANVLEDAKFSQFAKVMEEQDKREGYAKPFRGCLLSGDPVDHFARHVIWARWDEYDYTINDWRWRDESEVSEDEKRPQLCPRCGQTSHIGHLRGEDCFYCDMCGRRVADDGEGRGVLGILYTNECGHIYIEPLSYSALKLAVNYCAGVARKVRFDHDQAPRVRFRLEDKDRSPLTTPVFAHMRAGTV